LTGDALFKDHPVPLLVVLLGPGLPDAVVDALGEVRPLVAVRDGDVGDLFPRLVWNPGDQFQDFEFGSVRGCP
jgi:hypothetical protein